MFLNRNTINFQMYSNFLKYTPNLLVIFYENLVKDPLKEVQKIVNFLGFEIDPKRLKCLEKYSEGPVKREHIQVKFQHFKDI